MAQIFTRIGQLGFGLAVAGAVANSALYNVEGGHRAVIFDRVSGVNKNVVGEGTHFMIPWIQKPYIFDIRARPKNVPSVTGSKDLQNVNITLRILFRPRWNILLQLGPDNRPIRKLSILSKYRIIFDSNWVNQKQTHFPIVVGTFEDISSEKLGSPDYQDPKAVVPNLFLFTYPLAEK